MIRPAAVLRLLSIAGLFFLAACAGDVAKPTSVQALSQAQQSSIRTSDVSAEAGTGVDIKSYEIDRVVERVKLELAKVEQERPADAQTAKVKIILTEYDKGNAFARAMMAGLGQIKIEADVIFVDETNGQEIGRYKVAKDFAFGGLVGATTNIEDVEEGFAKSVAEILKKT
jgi:hypothetical protein